MKRLRVLLALVGTLLVIPVPVSAATPAFKLANGVTQPIHSLADAVRETVWVDTGLDLDGDGAGDRVAADIVRPAVSSKVPVIMDASPYYTTAGRGNEGEKKTYDSAGVPVKFPLFYDNYFVPRGYAVVLVDFAGTSRSRGCVDVGGKAEISSGTAVIDWLNGRRTGYSAVTGGSVRSASWSTGAVGMIGKSWDGTVTEGVAATGIAGLKTIVPIAGISSWYDWFRSDGVAFRGFGTPTSLGSGFENSNAQSRCGAVRQQMTSGAPANGDYTPMWQERDFVRKASNVRASVFVVHGQHDQNVKPLNYGQFLAAIPASVPRKVWLSQTAHVDPFDFRRAEWVKTLNRWFDRWLLDVPNGIENEPALDVERSPDVWARYATWPPAGTGLQTFYPSTSGLGTVAGSGTASFTDNGSGTPSKWVSSAAGRVQYATAVLGSDLRIAGTSSITVSVSSSTPTAHLTALLVDYGSAVTRSGEGIETLSTESCWGENRPGDDACYFDTRTTSASVDAQVVARGWADLANYASLSQPRTLVPGTRYSMTFRLSTADHIVPAGHRLALIIGGTDSSAISRPSQLPSLTVDLSGTSVRIPLVGAGIVGSAAPVTASRVPVEVTGTLR
ncbi:X-Pro dipeptidyl-peptidase [Lentzea sp. NBRC 105346]|uniref:Xaa-Pro dipeptidyl-peptidase n=1 Tax=Lentzea sp. NBRC 105346 TaxID=3032205 RepID=UPI0024A1CE6C|nr:Xaa-Pro dipeptidyl-peptidase [Lentzea sp. NBRC 105346]GLZ29566.1 X-Pro dipeptidyl-peptidase [Lentzea sp. NBRC 105346]